MIDALPGDCRRRFGTGKDAPKTNGVDVLGWDFAFEMNEVAKQQAAAANIQMRFLRIPCDVMDNHRSFVAEAGLMSYVLSWHNEPRNAATYVDRILRRDKPADLPVQTASKFETVLNLKAAKALGFTVPGGLLVAAADVID
jgi:ABC-type uncharacterized transport system substrate-binding protein